MGYSLALISLNQLSDADFRAIPECAREVIQERDTTQIVCKEQSWLYELCRDLPPTREEASNLQKIWPRFIPEKAIKKGGEAFVIKAFDTWRNGSVVLKIPLPLAKHDSSTKRIKRSIPGDDNKSKEKIVTNADGLWQVAKSLFYKKQDQKLEKSKFELEEEKKRKELDESSLYNRFHRSYIIQSQLYKKAKRTDPKRQWGYIPQCYEFCFVPKCYFSMEYVEGVEYIEYIKNNNDQANLNVYFNLVVFVEQVVHSLGVAHCDIAPKNILVQNGVPVLLDYGIVKGQTLEEITLVGSQLGSVAFAAPEQMTDARARGFLSDVFALGRLLWTTIVRREPLLESVIVEYDEDGKIVYDAETIGSLFDKNLLPVQYQAIYEKTQNGKYLDISELRSDLEGLSLPDSNPITFCQEPCTKVLEIEKRLNNFVRFLRREKLED